MTHRANTVRHWLTALALLVLSSAAFGADCNTCAGGACTLMWGGDATTRTGEVYVPPEHECGKGPVLINFRRHCRTEPAQPIYDKTSDQYVWPTPNVVTYAVVEHPCYENRREAWTDYPECGGRIMEAKP